MKDLIFLDSVKQMPMMPLPVRSTCVVLPNARILISPGSNLRKEQLQSLEEVTDIVGTSFFHCAGVAKAHKVFPNARVWGPPGAKKVKPEIPWTDELTEENWPYQKELSSLLIAGMPKVNEIVFFHHGYQTLLVSDLCFNMADAHGIGPWLILTIFGTYKKFAVSKFFLKAVEDKSAFTKSVKKLLAWPILNIVVSHGLMVRGDGGTKLQKALAARGVV